MVANFIKIDLSVLWKFWKYPELFTGTVWKKIIYSLLLKQVGASIFKHVYQHCIYRSISHREKFNIHTKQNVYLCPVMSKQEPCTKLLPKVGYIYYYSQGTSTAFNGKDGFNI